MRWHMTRLFRKKEEIISKKGEQCLCNNTRFHIDMKQDNVADEEASNLANWVLSGLTCLLVGCARQVKRSGSCHEMWMARLCLANVSQAAAVLIPTLDSIKQLEHTRCIITMNQASYDVAASYHQKNQQVNKRLTLRRGQNRRICSSLTISL